jgi:hypothetical protein
LRRILVVTVPAFLIATFVFAAAIEVWVRATWDPRRGTPGLFLTDAVRGQRFAANYDGWFAGVPVHINNLGFRDPRDYALAKGPRTFRIVFLGDSVTFGHSSVYEHTYPYLLEQRLKMWRPGVDWQVWNLGVPGYNTSQELAHLEAVGPAFAPDLVIVGFFENDLVDNRDNSHPGFARVVAARVLSQLQRHVYSFDLYKKVVLRLVWRLSASDAFGRRLESLADDEKLLATVKDASLLKQQAITPVDYVSDEELRTACPHQPAPNHVVVDAVEHREGYRDWLDAIRGFQRLSREGAYRILFFLNAAPGYCPDTDTFYDEGPTGLNAFLVRTIGAGLPVVSSHDAFLHRRPSQMPAANGHSLGNSNVIKADVLFDYLRAHELERFANTAASSVPTGAATRPVIPADRTPAGATR